MARTFANDPALKYKFSVSMAGIPTGMGFQKVSGLERELEVVEYAEGGYKHIQKMPGREKVSTITLEKGVFVSKFMEALYKSSLSSSTSRATLIIIQYDQYGKEVRKWTLAEAWVSKWGISDLDAQSNDLSIEKIEVQYEYVLD